MCGLRSHKHIYFTLLLFYKSNSPLFFFFILCVWLVFCLVALLFVCLLAGTENENVDGNDDDDDATDAL